MIPILVAANQAVEPRRYGIYWGQRCRLLIGTQLANNYAGESPPSPVLSKMPRRPAICILAHAKVGTSMQMAQCRIATTLKERRMVYRPCSRSTGMAPGPTWTVPVEES